MPNLPCVIRKRGKTDVYGKTSLGSEMPERCGIVKAKYKSVDTTKRGDSGASRSHADEFISESRVLLMPKTAAEVDDQLTVIGFKIRIKMKHPRYNVMGKLDHWEVEGEIWA